jgi:hypothetical protein
MSMKCAVIGHIYCKKVIAVAKTARSGKISKLIILLWARFDCTLYFSVATALNSLNQKTLIRTYARSEVVVGIW